MFSHADFSAAIMAFPTPSFVRTKEGAGNETRYMVVNTIKSKSRKRHYMGSDSLNILNLILI